MKKLIAIILALLIFAASAAAETPPASGHARPSRAWLGSVSTGLVADLNALSASGDMSAVLQVPDSVATLIAPAAAYEAEPSLVLYAPADVTAMFSLLSGGATLSASASENADQLCLKMLAGMLCQYCSSEQLALSGAVTLSQYCFHAPIRPTIALFAPAGGEQGNPIMIQYSSGNGIVSMGACYMPLSVYSELANPASVLSIALTALNVDILRGGDISPEFSEAAVIPANIPAADEAWLEQTAFDIAQGMIDKCADPAYVSLFTTDEELMNVCGDVGSVSLSSAQVSSITYYDAGDLAGYFDLASASNLALVEKYYAPQHGVFSIQEKLNSYGVLMAAAGSICATNDVRAAAGDFTSCVVILNTSCTYDIAVSFGMVEENIVIISAKPIPAE